MRSSCIATTKTYLLVQRHIIRRVIVKIGPLVLCTVHPFTQLSKSCALQYFSVGQTPSKSLLHELAFGPHLIHASLHPPKSTSQTASRLVQPFLHSLWQSVPIVYNKKVKAPHTRHRALGPELIPVYRQSARR